MTQSDLENLKKAYYSGVLKVREGDTWVEYHSMREMRLAIKDAEAELSNNTPKGSRLTSVGKGY